VIPTRNRAADLGRCLEALLAQDYPPARCEVVVVDDDSTDATTEVAAGLNSRFASLGKSLKYIRSSSRGTNVAVNAGLKTASGQVIVTMGDDTLTPATWLKALVNGLVESGAEAVSGPLKIPTAGPLLGKHREEIVSCVTEVTAPVYWDGVMIPVAGNMAAWRGVYERALFDETVRTPVEEVDWVLRAKARAAFVPEAWAWHSKGPEVFRPGRLLRKAWMLGSEGGWWVRERYNAPRHERRAMALRSLATSARAFGHALLQRCWGGAVVGLGELARALALVGWINRSPRRPESWR